MSGTITPILGERAVRLETGRAAEFSTMLAHAFKTNHSPAEILVILEHDRLLTHLHPGREPPDCAARTVPGRWSRPAAVLPQELAGLRPSTFSSTRASAYADPASAE
ncbi:hypothetical protein J2W56_006723 [Nocardia kruczakiae]|uniref:Uncharacterized protein n=1 Tax=Nocardia kruczakiae TaxID=261477 RepID=A0ABU1XQV9_9NOCA|nr:hypothetical protein [Nocardia kruczakiae]